MTESRLQHLIIGWLKDMGAYVIKTKPQPGIPVGCPDIIAFYNGHTVFIEVKATSKSEYQNGQKATHDFLRQQNFEVFVAHSENWQEIKQILSKSFFHLK